MKEKKFSLSTLVYAIISIDVFLFYAYDGPEIVFNILPYELVLILGIVLGLRGQGHYKKVLNRVLGKLYLISEDVDLDDHEDLRGHKLKQQVRFDCLELDIHREKQNNNSFQ